MPSTLPSPTPTPSTGQGNGRVVAPATAADLWRMTALISAAFVVIVAVAMLIGYKRAAAEDPIGARELSALREKLHSTPTDEALKKQIRELDLRERQRYFNRVRRNTSGAWLLVLGGGMFVFSAARFFASRRRLPLPRPLATPFAISREATRARAALIGVSAGIVVALAVVGTMKPVRSIRESAASKSAGPAGSAPTSVQMSPAAPGLTPEQYRAQWPRFRGADGNGYSALTNIPTAWKRETGENIVWRSAVPLAGFNSPVIWGKRLFLTGSSETERAVFCFDTASGELQWKLPVTLVNAEAVAEMEIPKMSGATAATAACDDKRVFAIFATGELVASDHEGHVLWSKNFGKLENGYGHATSLVVWRDRLLLQLDQGTEEAAKSRLYALDPATGNIIWQQRRALPSSWATPLIITSGNAEQIVCLGEPWLISYNFLDGKELWKYQGLGSDLTPSPIFAAGLVIAISPNQRFIALRPDGQGDITKTHVAWQVDQNVPDISSPASNGELIFAMETSGTLVCLEAATGKKAWEHSYDGEFQSSLAIAGQHLYVSSTEGDTYVLDAGREYKEHGHNKLGEGIRASFALTEGHIFIRGATNLFCIGSKGGAK